MLEAALEHYQTQQQLSRHAAQLAARTWLKDLAPRDLDRSWRGGLGRQLVQLVGSRQTLAASYADDYTDQVLVAQHIDHDRTATVRPIGLAGQASDGRPLATLLYEPIIQIKTSLLGGQGLDQAVKYGTSSLIRIVATQVSDAGRVAAGIALTARPAAGGYVRMLTPPSCPRCAVLAGKFYRWNAGFARHPRCDCQHVPTVEKLSHDLRTDPELAFVGGQITGLSKADEQALRDGADIGKVVNAHRGMYTASSFGQRIKATTEGAKTAVRLRPEAIYAHAGNDRYEALRLLKKFGYLT